MAEDDFHLFSLSQNTFQRWLATKEKALVDIIANRRDIHIRSKKDMKTRILEDLRIDELTLLLELDVERVDRFASLYGSANTKLPAFF